MAGRIAVFLPPCSPYFMPLSLLSTLPRERITPCAGAGAGLSAHLLWGVAVLFWPLLADMSPVSIMAHRMIWSCVFMGLLLLYTGQMRGVLALAREPKVLFRTFCSAALLGTNWSIFLWAVNTGQVLETSLGYFITPLLNVLMGRIFLGERLSRLQALAIALAAAGVTFSIAAYGHIPLTGLSLAVTFALYGYLQKTVRVALFPGFFTQTLMLVPPALLWLAFVEQGLGFFGHGMTRQLELVGTVLFTGLPLILFGYAARHVTLATIGILQYVSPSINFVLAITVLGESMKASDKIAFPMIWLALAIYTWDAIHQLRKIKEGS